MEWKKVLISSVFLFCFLPISAKAVTYFSDCLWLTIPNETYVLTSDLINKTGFYESDTGRYSCIRFQANNITLDCQGHLIDGQCEYGHHGIRISSDNITLKNCYLKEWTFALINNGNYNYISHITILSSDGNILENPCFLLPCIGYNVFDNIDVRGGYCNAGAALYGQVRFWSPIGTIIRNSRFNNTQEPWEDWEFHGTSSQIYNNTFTVKTMDILNTGGLPIFVYNNLFNFSSYLRLENIRLNITRQIGIRIYSTGIEIGGNYWSGYSDTCIDSTNDGFCDVPYTISGETDYLPYSIHYVPPTPLSCRICDTSQMPDNFVFYPIKGICLLANLLTCQTMSIVLVLVFFIFMFSMIYFKFKDWFR